MTRLGPSPGVGVVVDGATVYAAPLPDGPIVVLDGGAGAIWIAACGGDRSSIVDRVAALTGAPAEDIRDEVDLFVEDLVRRGIMAERER